MSPRGQEEEEVRLLREALRSSEDQVQLIHSEYRSICHEKDDMIRSLKAALEQTGEHQRGEAHRSVLCNYLFCIHVYISLCVCVRCVCVFVCAYAYVCDVHAVCGCMRDVHI